MRSVHLLVIGCVLSVSVLTTSFEGQERPITIRAGTLLDVLAHKPTSIYERRSHAELWRGRAF